MTKIYAAALPALRSPMPNRPVLPFGDRLQIEPARQVEQHVDESAVLIGFEDFRERAVDLDDARRRVYGNCETRCHRRQNRPWRCGSRGLDARDEASRVVQIVESPLSR
jgi:hypothetical protein